MQGEEEEDGGEEDKEEEEVEGIKITRKRSELNRAFEFHLLIRQIFCSIPSSFLTTPSPFFFFLSNPAYLLIVVGFLRPFPEFLGKVF